MEQDINLHDTIDEINTEIRKLNKTSHLNSIATREAVELILGAEHQEIM